MAFSTTAIQPTSAPVNEKPVDNGAGTAMLAAMLLSLYTAQKSKKAFRKMKRKFLWTAFKLKLKSLFSRKAATNDRLLIYILIGIVALVLVFYYPIAALIVALVALLLILLGKL
jgi:hypothetical protein